MSKINLLPWREELRREQLTVFVALLALTLALALLVFFGGHVYNNFMISTQVSRNERLSKEIRDLNVQIREIETLEKERDAIKSRMKVIEGLQADRPAIVYLFDEFVKTVPEGLYLEFLQQNGDTINLRGVAQSNARVSEYMTNLSSSAWLANPKLNVINAAAGRGERERQFALSVKQITPEQEKN